MAARISGVTRASSLGPISEFMERHGGSIARVLRDVDLPFALLEQPEIIVPLREQFRLLERSARETGDAYFGARLGQAVSSPGLSAYGAWVCSADTLRNAMKRAEAGLATMLQTSTNLHVAREAGAIRWSIEFVEPETDGRHHNELLGVGYMMDLVRVYAGSKWRPDVVMTALPSGEPRGELERIFGTNVSNGHAMSSIVFDAALLDRGAFRPVPGSTPENAAHEPPVPENGDTLAALAAVTELALHEGYPRIDWVAAKLGTTRRTLQRHLNAHGKTFNGLVEETLFRHARTLLAEDILPVTEIAFRLGYADAAHFTRAFRRWAGVAPSVYRETAAGAA
ncbi:AraC family transcriptional regulator [Hyphomicrobium zavarzinii]|jgi:AraC-like DNA-binding protein|uniref:AraC family transcriptional regulator n=1 Tax=Hyphomicrobium zavarzinii TaxID=48292 RepID=UPI00037FF942|nr:AraC family transcriptional regulator [Hyphomicrobium zavarzinii]